MAVENVPTFVVRVARAFGSTVEEAKRREEGAVLVLGRRQGDAILLPEGGRAEASLPEQFHALVAQVVGHEREIPLERPEF